MIEIFPDYGVVLDDDRCRETMGLPIRNVVDYWIPDAAVKRETISVLVVERVIELVREAECVLPGAHDAVALFEERGLPVAIASSSDQALIDAVVDVLGVHERIPVRLSAQHLEYGKPHPGIYLAAARELGVAPEHCVAIEDAPNGILSAKSARMRCIAVPDPSLADNPVYGIADTSIASLTDLDWSLVENL